MKEAYELDRQNVNTFWADAIQCELNQLFEYDTFHDKGQLHKTPNGYQLIRCHFGFDVKQSGKHKACFVAGGHMTNPAKDSIYSGVVGLRSLHIISFLAELNGLELMAADVGNAYLEACTKEKVCFIAGQEFGKRSPSTKGQVCTITTTFVDANLMHDFTTGRSATGVLHLLNQTPNRLVLEAPRPSQNRHLWK